MRTRGDPTFVPKATPRHLRELPRILLGGVNRNMTRIAGEAADGFMTHPTNTNPRYLKEVLLPNLDHGAARTNRSRSHIDCIGSTFVATGPDRGAVEEEKDRLREYLGFVFSTPQYWPTLELLGWEGVGKTLLEDTRAGRWAEMKTAIPDELFNELVPSSTYEEIVPLILDWYGGVLDAVTLRIPADSAHDSAFAKVVEQLRDSSRKMA